MLILFFIIFLLIFIIFYRNIKCIIALNIKIFYTSKKHTQLRNESDRPLMSGRCSLSQYAHGRSRSSHPYDSVHGIIVSGSTTGYSSQTDSISSSSGRQRLIVRTSSGSHFRKCKVCILGFQLNVHFSPFCVFLADTVPRLIKQDYNIN